MMNTTILLVESAEGEKVKKLKTFAECKKQGRTHSKLPRKTPLDLSLMVYSLNLNRKSFGQQFHGAGEFFSTALFKDSPFSS